MLSYGGLGLIIGPRYEKASYRLQFADLLFELYCTLLMLDCLDFFSFKYYMNRNA